MTDTSTFEPTISQRIIALMRHLGISRAHFLVGNDRDTESLLRESPEVVSSMTFVTAGPVGAVAALLGDRAMVISGDRGPMREMHEAALSRLPSVRRSVLTDYNHVLWSDVAADRGEQILGVLLPFLAEITRREQIVNVSVSGVGEVESITYRCQGSGAPLFVLPIGLAASQWDPILPVLSENYCTIVLGGRRLGAVEALESRTRAFLSPVASLFEYMALQPGERVLDVGCGSGAYDRWLARRFGGVAEIVAIDLSPYLLREAEALTVAEGLEGAIRYEQANAEKLPFQDASFDAAFSVTALEECNADLALHEMVRVVKPGGRVGVMVRAIDAPASVHAPMSAALRSKIEAPLAARGLVVEGGCADESLYRRLQEQGLQDLHMTPLWYTFDSGGVLEFMESVFRRRLGPPDQEEWDAAVVTARQSGTFFISQPCHCVVGTKPFERRSTD